MLEKSRVKDTKRIKSHKVVDLYSTLMIDQTPQGMCLYCKESPQRRNSAFCSTKCAADLEYHVQKQRKVDKFLDGYEALIL